MSEQPVASVGIVGLAALSPREQTVVREVAGGDTYAVIADRLGVSEQTVKNQMHAARGKLDSPSTIGVFVRLGWLRIP